MTTILIHFPYILSPSQIAKVNVPAVLAYGPKGFPGRVPANADLVFDLELISF